MHCAILTSLASVCAEGCVVAPGPRGGLTIEVSFPPAVGARSRLTLATAWAKRGSPRASLGD